MKNLLLFVLSIIVATSNMKSQTMYKININVPEKEIVKGHLDLGGKNPAGDVISVNSYYIEMNNKPFFPIIGELHYSRYPAEYWEESIRKLKAGGINTIATYVFWNIHEREEGKFDWSGDLNLRRFIELVKKNGMYAIVRMGPFCHGEMRNGGIPDWLYGRTFEIRSNDPEYLHYVDLLYGQIAAQIKGMLFKEDGPVIAIQLENEYQHSAAPWELAYPGSRKEFTVADWQATLAHEQITVTDGVNPWAQYGKDHMAKLKEIAKKHGIDVPLYTATGWGNAAIVEKGSIPVTAGYVYPFWSPPAQSSFYLFKDIHKYPDYMPVSYETELYPSIPAEIGPGIQVKYSRRPVVDFQSINPLMVRIIGSGSNGIGYYMYHGGSTPSFDGKFYNEEVNGLPRVNYDFQAPIGQYGQTRYHFKSLKVLHMFLESYAEILAPMKTVLPETNAQITPEDINTLRYAVRSYGNSGFVFIINYQDHLEISEIKNVRIEIDTKNETITFPFKGTITIPKAASAILPFNLKLENVMVKSGTVQPLTILKIENKPYYIFSAVEGIQPEMVFPAKTKITGVKKATSSTTNSGTIISGNSSEPFSFIANGNQFLVIPQKMALDAVKIGEHLFISNALVLEANNNIQFISSEASSELNIFPAIDSKPTIAFADITNNPAPIEGMTSYQINFTKVNPEVIIEKTSGRKYSLSLNSDISNLHDVFINVDYVGDRGMAFINGKMITDHFYHERQWEISLRKFIPELKNNELVLIFHPMHSEYEYLMDLHKIPEFENNSYLKINGFEVVPEYKAILSIE